MNPVVNFIIHTACFVGIAVTLITLEVYLFTWQFWSIMILATAIQFNAAMKASN